MAGGQSLAAGKRLDSGERTGGSETRDSWGGTWQHPSLSPGQAAGGTGRA